MRKFLRDKLNLKATNVGDGWLIFDLPEADFGCHPADDTGKESMAKGTADISFYCDDIYKTVAELKEKGVEFKAEIENHRFGFVTYFPGAGKFQYSK